MPRENEGCVIVVSARAVSFSDNNRPPAQIVASLAPFLRYFRAKSVWIRTYKGILKPHVLPTSHS